MEGDRIDSGHIRPSVARDLDRVKRKNAAIAIDVIRVQRISAGSPATKSRRVSSNVLSIILASTGRWTELDGTLAESERDVPDNLSPYYRAASIIIGQGNDYPREDTGERSRPPY
jgi:hypothetical protein